MSKGIFAVERCANAVAVLVTLLFIVAMLCASFQEAFAADIYAQDTQPTLIVNPNGGSFNNSTSTQTFTQSAGSAKTLVSPSRTGYTFVGWANSGVGQVDNVRFSSSTFDNGISDVSVYNNQGTSCLSLSSVNATGSMPIPASKIMRLTCDGSAETWPAYGGFSRSYPTAYGDRITVVVVAKVPSGLYVGGVTSAGGGTDLKTLSPIAGDNTWHVYAWNWVQTAVRPQGYFVSSPDAEALYHNGVTASPPPYTIDVALYQAYYGDIGANTSYTFVNGTTTLTAMWVPNKSSIILDNQSADEAGTEQLYTCYNDGVYTDYLLTDKITPSVTKITVPEKDGYSFGGYYTAPSGGGTQMISADGTVSSALVASNYASNTRLYAKWSACYSVRFDSNGGSGGMSDQSGFVYNSAQPLNSNAFSAPAGGYAFAGWATSTSDAASGAIAYDNGDEMVTGSTVGNDVVVLYAIWRRSIVFHHGINQASTITVNQYYDGDNDSGATITSPQSTECSAIDLWEKEGWKASQEASSPDIDFNTVFTPSATQYYAVYARVASLQYLGGNEAVGGTTPSTSQITQYYNSAGGLSQVAFTLAANQYVMLGYVFGGWSLGMPGEEYSWTPGLQVEPALVAVAEWDYAPIPTDFELEKPYMFLVLGTVVWMALMAERVLMRKRRVDVVRRNIEDA